MKLYAIDWTDEAFPEIIPAESHPFDSNHGQTFTGCKHELIRHWQSVRDHAREQIKNVSRLRVSDVEDQR